MKSPQFQTKFRRWLAVILFPALLACGCQSWHVVSDERLLLMTKEPGYRSRPKKLAKARTRWGDKALHFACIAGDLPLVNAMIDSGTSINLRGGSGKTPAMAAVCSTNVAVIQNLVDRGADLTSVDEGKWNAVHWAMVATNLPALKLLIQHVPLSVLDAKDKMGQTPAHVAAEAGFVAGLKEVLAAGANPNTTNIIGIPPVFNAIWRGDTNSIALLAQYGASLTNLFEGRSAMDVAAHIPKSLEILKTSHR